MQAVNLRLGLLYYDLAKRNRVATLAAARVASHSKLQDHLRRGPESQSHVALRLEFMRRLYDNARGSFHFMSLELIVDLGHAQRRNSSDSRRNLHFKIPARLLSASALSMNNV